MLRAGETAGEVTPIGHAIFMIFVRVTFVTVSAIDEPDILSVACGASIATDQFAR
jgi:hypothetical protein